MKRSESLWKEAEHCKYGMLTDAALMAKALASFKHFATFSGPGGRDVTINISRWAYDFNMDALKYYEENALEYAKLAIMAQDAEKQEAREAAGEIVKEVPQLAGVSDFPHDETVTDPSTGRIYKGQFYFNNGDDVSDRLKMAQ